MSYYNNYIPFDRLSEGRKILYIKNGFCELVNEIFIAPQIMRGFIDSKLITTDEAQIIIQEVFNLNVYACVCCREYAYNKLKLDPINSSLSPLIDIVIDRLKQCGQLTN